MIILLLQNALKLEIEKNYFQIWTTILITLCIMKIYNNTKASV